MKRSDLKNLIREEVRAVLTESATMWIPAARDDHEPAFEHMGDLKSELFRVALDDWSSWTEFEKESFHKQHSGFHVGENADYFDETGEMYFVIGSIGKQRIKPALAKATKFMDKYGLKYAIKPGKVFGGRDAFIINITHNPESGRISEEDTAPEINLANANMRILLHVLGYSKEANDDQPGGTVKANDLLIRVLNIKEDDIADKVRAPYHSDMEKFRNPDQKQTGPTMIDGGTNVAQIKQYLQRVHLLAKWAVKHGFDEISIG